MVDPTPDRRGIGVAQGLGSNYPFLVKPPASIEHLVADFYVAVDAMSPDGGLNTVVAATPWRISWLYGLGTGSIGASPMSPTHSVDVLVTGLGDYVIFDSRKAVRQTNPLLPNYEPNAGFVTQAFGPSMTAYLWTMSTGVCRLIAYDNWVKDAQQLSFLNDIFPVGAYLDPRTTTLSSQYIRSVSVLGQKIYVADLQLAAGYNTQLTSKSAVSVAGKLVTTQASINVAPGIGLGTYNNCEALPLEIKSINKVAPDSAGNFSLAGKDCVNIFESTVLLGTRPRVTLPSTAVNPAAPNLIIRDDCKACCDCPDYVSAAKSLVGTYTKYASIAAEVKASRDTYHQNVHRWNASRKCREDNSLRLVLQPQGCPFLDVMAQYCNQSPVCQYNIQLRIRFASVPAVGVVDCTPVGDLFGPPANLPAYRSNGVTVVPGSTSRSLSVPRTVSLYTLQGSWCDYRAYWDAVNPLDTVYVKFRLRFPHGGAVDGVTPYGVTGWLDALVGEHAIKRADTTVLLQTATAALRCGTVGG